MPHQQDTDKQLAKQRKPDKPETQKRGYKPRANKKQDILEAAMRVFGHYGYEMTTMEMIANEAAVSRALVIKYFQNVEQVAKLAAQYFFNRFYEQVQYSAARPGITYWEHTENIFEMLKVNRSQWRFVLSYLMPPAREDVISEIPPARLKDITDKVPDTCRPKNIPHIEHMMASLYLSYIIGGNERKYSECKRGMFELLNLL